MAGRAELPCLSDWRLSLLISFVFVRPVFIVSLLFLLLIHITKEKQKIGFTCALGLALA